MTNLTQAQTKAMETLKLFYNPQYASETLCHVSDVAISGVTRNRLVDEGFITVDCGFISFTDKGKEMMWLTVAEVVSEVEATVEVEMTSPDGKKFVASAKVEGDSYVVKTSMREVKFSKKTMKTTGKFAGWRLVLKKPKVEATQPQTVKAQRVNPDLFEAYQRAVTEFEAANEEYMQAESQWLKTGQWPDDKRDAGKVRESALDAKKVASNNYYNLN